MVLSCQGDTFTPFMEKKKAGKCNMDGLGQGRTQAIQHFNKAWRRPTHPGLCRELISVSDNSLGHRGMTKFSREKENSELL